MRVSARLPPTRKRGRRSLSGRRVLNRRGILDYNQAVKSHTGLILLILVLGACAGLVAWRAVTFDASAAAARPDAEARGTVAVEVAPIEAGLIREVRVLSGTLEASTRFDVAPKVAGLIQEIHVDLGDPVERDQVVATLDDDEFVQAVAQAKAELAVREAEVLQAKAELERVERDYARLEDLRKRGVASDYEFDEVTALRSSRQAAVQLSQARARQAEALLEVANIRLNYTSVRASWRGGPDRGIVGTRYEDAGDTVQIGDPILAVVGLDPLLGVVSVTERDYTLLSVGQTATLTTEAVAGRTFDAQVARIAPVFRESSRQARVEFRVDNADHVLRPGMFIRVRVVLREAQADAIIPTAAVVQRAGRSVVFTVNPDESTVTQHPVELGIVQDERVQVLRPPLAGRVVVLGQHLLEDGAAVRIVE